MRSSLLRMSRFFFNQAGAEKKNIFKLPQQQFLKHDTICQINQLLEQAQSCRVLAAVFKQNIDMFTDQHVTQLYRHINSWQFEIDNSFHQVIAPITLQFVKAYTRENSSSLLMILDTLLKLKIDSPQLLNAVIAKLDGQNIYRYVSLDLTLDMLGKLLAHPELRKSGLTRKFAMAMYQQKEYYLGNKKIVGQYQQVVQKLEVIKSEEPQLTEALKQLQ